MELLLSVSECFAKDILTSWLTLIEVCRVDTAFCIHRTRPEFLQQLSTEPAVYTNCLTIQAMHDKLKYFINWLILRKIFVQEFMIDIGAVESKYFLYGGHLIKKICLIDVYTDTEASMLSALNIIAQQCAQIEDIKLPINKNITSEQFDALLKMHNLKRLELRGNHVMSPFCNHIAAWPKLIVFQAAETTIRGEDLAWLVQHCPLLESLNLRACDWLEDVDLVVIAAHCPSLMHLYVQDTMLTDDVLGEIARNCPHLEEVHLGENLDITDSSIAVLAEHCTKLAVLDIRQCAITDESLLSLAQHSRHLRYLDVSECTEVSDIGVAALVTGCPRLQQVCLDILMGQVTEASVVLLGEGRAVLLHDRRHSARWVHPDYPDYDYDLSVVGDGDDANSFPGINGDY